MTICWVDIETVGLDPDRHHIFEIACIIDDFEQVWAIQPDLTNAESAALRVNRYYERCEGAGFEYQPPGLVALDVAMMTAGCVLGGAVPSFDAAFLNRFLRSQGYAPAWSHRLLCVETFAAGALRCLPEGLNKMAANLGIPVDESVAHTALGDARLAKAVFDAVMEGRADVLS